MITEIRYEGLQFYGASLYLPIDRDIERDLGTIEKIIWLTKALDSYAGSKIWSDTHTNPRGREMEDFIIKRDLFIMNVDSDVPTLK